MWSGGAGMLTVHLSFFLDFFVFIVEIFFLNFLFYNFVLDFVFRFLCGQLGHAHLFEYFF